MDKHSHDDDYHLREQNPHGRHRATLNIVRRLPLRGHAHRGILAIPAPCCRIITDYAHGNAILVREHFLVAMIYRDFVAELLPCRATFIVSQLRDISIT